MDDGTPYMRNTQTGEVVEMVPEYVVPGSTITLPQEMRERRLSKREQYYRWRATADRSKARGQFLFILSGNPFDGVQPESLARLIYLATYIRFGEKSPYMTQRRKIKRGNLAEFLGVSKSTVDRFWHDVSPIFLTEDENGDLVFNGDYIRRGSIGRSKGRIYRRVYIDAFRSLYKNTSPSKHKLIGYLLRFLDDLHKERNVICRDPYAEGVPPEDVSGADPLTVQDFCLMINYSLSNAARMRHDFEELRFQADGQERRAVAFCEDGIFVNPYLMYSGDDHASILPRFLAHHF